jgi:drug/metabolite transporter (DMT)-like permease
VIGSLAYLTPLLSTVNLVLFGGQRLSGLALLAMTLIILGAVVGTWENPFGSGKSFRFCIPRRL